MKVMFFIFEGFDTTNGTNHLVLTTIKELLDSGIEVYLLESHTTGVYPDIPCSIQNNPKFTYSIVQRNIVKKKNFIQRYLDGFNYAVKASKEWRKHCNDIDLVLLQSTHTAWISVFLMNLWLKKPIVYNSFDIFPDGPYYYGAIRNKLVYKVLSSLQNYIYKSCSKIVVISDDMKQTFLEKGINENKLITIPNWYDSAELNNSSNSKNVFLKKYNINRDKFIIQYAGNIGYTFNYKAIIEIAKLLKDTDNIQFHIIGNGGFEDSFKEEVKKERLDNIIFFPWQDSSIIYDVYSSCDIELIPLSKGVIWTSFPSKCTLLMACGKSFLCLCEKESAFYSLVNSKKIGFCLDRDDYKGAADLLIELSHNRMLLNEYGDNGRMVGKKYYSSKVNACKYVEMINEMVGEK